MRRTLLTLLPKVALSRTTGWLTRIPLPRRLRKAAFTAFARRYGADLEQLDRELESFRSLGAFFSRPLAAGARPLAGTPLVWPCDGRIVTCGPLQPAATGDAPPRVLQVKGQDYGLDELLGISAGESRRFEGGSQATVYLAPGDYHRVHAPFDGTLTGIRRLRGTLFPVNPPAVRAIPSLFVRNARCVFDFELTDGRHGAVVMVGALNVGNIRASVDADARPRCRRGDEIGRFGFGSTTIAVIEHGEPAWPATAPETRVLQGGAVEPETET